MTYSSAVFTGPEVSLAAAQDEKYARVIAALGLEDGHRVLEIGCGWGGFAEAAARSGAFVDGITLSREQLAYASERIARAGLDARVRLRFEDYRDTTGGFDRIASIAMVAAVGEPHWPVYFAPLHDRLVPGGVAVLQAITIREQSYAAYRERPDFIQRYVFPGGMLPTRTIMADQAERAGLTFEPLETFGASYARTLAIWRDRFEAAWPRIAALGFDDRFRRLWNFYLTYCEVGFERGVVDVGLYRFTRPA